MECFNKRMLKKQNLKTFPVNKRAKPKAIEKLYRASNDPAKVVENLA